MKNKIIALGRFKTTIIATMISVVTSIAITIVVIYISELPFYKIPLAISIICPLIICPPITLLLLELLFKIHRLERSLTSRHNAILEAVPDIIMEIDMNNIYIWANKTGYEFFGKDVIGMNMNHYSADEQNLFQQMTPIFKGEKENIYIESLQSRQDGEKRILAFWCCAMKNESDKIISIIFSARDITEIKKSNENAAQSQKMEAVGQLAGGIAHDFNNQLSGITGFCELIKKQVDNDPSLISYTDNILLASQRSSDLIKQLLSFARKEKLKIIPVDIHKLINEVTSILKRTIIKAIDIELNLNAHSSIVRGDPSQLQNVFLNIGINARDAMPMGGDLIFTTTIKSLDQEYIENQCFKITPDIYIEINITDSGFGMDLETQKRIFEPFFTTKDAGEGTGMGLSTVYGVIKNHMGAINVSSMPDHGTTLKIYLPVSEGKIN